MKKIVFFIYSMSNSGGCERVVANLALSFDQIDGYTISIITVEGQKSFFQLPANVDVINLTSKGAFQKIREFVRLINSWKPDIVIGVGMNKLNILLSVCSFFFCKGIKVIASEHVNYNTSSRIQKCLKFIFYRFCLKFVVLTQSNEICYKKLGLKNVCVIPNASTYSPKEVVDIIKREKIILAVGRLEVQKSFDRLIAIWANLYKEHPNWKLLIIGEGRLENSLKEQIINLGMTVDNCEIMPFTNHIEKYYNNAQIYAMTSLFEGLPMVLIEAMAYGCPIISYDCESGPREIIENEITGFLIPNNQYAAFIEKLDMLISSNDLREKFFKNALVHRQKFSSENIINLWISCFR